MSNFFKADESQPEGGKYARLVTGLGLATAAALGAAWANARSKSIRRQGPPTLIDWEKVRATAYRLNPGGEATAEWHTHWNAYYSELVLKVVPVIEEYGKTSFPRTLDTVRAASRHDWIDANILSFKQLFEPFEAINRRAVERSSAFSQAVFGTLNQTVISAEVGLLLGYLGRRVLGQYDLSLLGKEPLSTGKVYFVEPNIKFVVDTLGVSGDEFRLWIALHETTHAFEFESHPWVREHFNSILEKYFGYITSDISKIGQNGVGSFLERVRRNDGTQTGWIERVMTPEQRALFQDLQALMSIVEGYSNHMMNAIGEKLMPNYNLIKERVESRQKNRSMIDKLFLRLTGLEVKMEQYRLGEIFVDAVVEKKGIEFANLMWAEAKYLPSLEEVKRPELWVSRVEQMQTPAPAALG